jgi:hypothetical protein
VLDIKALPDDVESLKRLLIEHHTASHTKDIQLREQRQEIEHLRFLLAKLQRVRFGQSSEQIEGAGQLPLTFQEINAALAEAERHRAAEEIKAAPSPKGQPVRRKQLPEHFERIPNLIQPKECACPVCGGALKGLGKDEAEVLEVKSRDVHGDPAYPPEEALREVHDHCAGTGTFAADPEELRGRLIAGVDSHVEVRFSSSALQAVSDLCPRRTEDHAHHPHAVGCGEQPAVGSIGGGSGQVCSVSFQHQRRRYTVSGSGAWNRQNSARTHLDLRARWNGLGVH